jgi:hypothetical protein
MNGMLTPPNAVAAADAFNSVRREIVILFLPTTSLFAFVRRKGPCRLVIMSRQSGQAFSLCDQRPRPSLQGPVEDAGARLLPSANLWEASRE